MRHAIIDLGTNTFNLLIIEEEGTIVFSDKVAVKLGKDCIDKNTISDQAIERAMDALRIHLDAIHKYKATDIHAIATSAIRSATNGNILVRKVKDELNLSIEVISGDKEAELIYYGVREALPMGEHNSLIMDIGGGSTEFIIASAKQIFWKQSFNLGISRLIEKFKPHDPVLPEEVKVVETYLMNELQPLFQAAQEFKFHTLIGSSGSFDTLADILSYKTHSHCLPINATTYLFDISQYKQLHYQLLQSTYDQRLAIKGMLAMRADMMVFGSIFIHLILEQLSISEMKLSTYALKEGVAWNIMKKKTV